MIKQEAQNSGKQIKNSISEKSEYCIQPISVKEDAGMTRIYSVVYPSNFFNNQNQFPNDALKEIAS